MSQKRMKIINYALLSLLVFAIIMNLFLLIIVCASGNIEIDNKKLLLFPSLTKTFTFLISEGIRICFYCWLICKTIKAIKNNGPFQMKISVFILLLIFVVIPYIQNFELFTNSSIQSFYKEFLRANPDVNITEEKFRELASFKLYSFNIISLLILISICLRFFIYFICIRSRINEKSKNYIKVQKN